MTEPVDLLAIAPHPDDAEVGCGGALMLSATRGLRTAIADLTLGESSTSGTPDRRASERAQASELLKLAERVDVGLPDGRVGTDPQHRDAIVELLRDLRPLVVLAPEVEDRHPDHAAAGRLVREACFLSGVGRLGRGAPYRPIRLYHYPLHHPCEPSFVLDVSAVWEQRMRAVDAYESQFGIPEDVGEATDLSGGGFRELISARSRVYGAMVGVAHGEPYRSRGPIEMRELPGIRDARPDRGPRYRTFM
jgi:bacillithiol biosynthesis deacetylase BshB1